MVSVQKSSTKSSRGAKNSTLVVLVTIGSALLHLIYTLLKAQVPSIPAAPAHCPPSETCERPDLIAFQILSGIVFLVCAILGIYGWYVDGACHSTPHRLFVDTSTTVPLAYELTLWNLTYQVWDFAISFVIPEFQSIILLAHHTAAATVAYAALRYNLLGYYAIFFMGLSEVSSIFLVVCDMGQYIPPTPGSWYDVLMNQVCAPLFVVTFVYFRVILWWYPITHHLLRDVSKGFESKRVPSWVLCLLLVLDVPMGFLQLYWMILIAQKVQEIVVDEA